MLITNFDLIKLIQVVHRSKLLQSTFDIIIFFKYPQFTDFFSHGTKNVHITVSN